MHDVVMVERCDQTMAECRSCDWVSGWHRGDFGRGVAETMAKNHRAVSKLDHVLTVSKMPNMSWQPGEANAIRVATGDGSGGSSLSVRWSSKPTASTSRYLMAGEPRMKNYTPNPPWPKARAERLAVDDYCCQASTFGVMTVCDYRPTGLAEVHHRLPRGRGGRNDLDNLVTLCPGHHRWVETERAAAKERGLLL